MNSIYYSLTTNVLLGIVLIIIIATSVLLLQQKAKYLPLLFIGNIFLVYGLITFQKMPFEDL